MPIKAISQTNNDRNFDYGMSRDRISDSRYADETAYSRGATAQQTAYQRALDASKYGDFTGLRNLGIDTRGGSEKDYSIGIIRIMGKPFQVAEVVEVINQN